MVYYLIIITAAAIDRVLKHFVSTGMSPGESKYLIGNVISLTYVKNSGVAFSMFTGHRFILIAVTALMIAVGLVYVTKHRGNRSSFLMTSAALVIAGGIGNLIDRIMYGYVIDYIDIGRFPVFNFADCCVVTGCVFLCIYIVFVDRE